MHGEASKGSITRIRFAFEDVSLSNDILEPNKINQANGIAPNRTGYLAYFASDYKRAAFAMLIHEALSHNIGNSGI